MTTRYANTDLDLVAGSEIDQLVREFATKCHVLSYVEREGNWYATIEASPDASIVGRADRSAEEHLRHLLSVVDGLSPDALGQWKACSRRDLNVGIECGDTWAFALSFDPEIIGMVARRGCSITMTIYPPKAE